VKTVRKAIEIRKEISTNILEKRSAKILIEASRGAEDLLVRKAFQEVAQVGRVSQDLLELPAHKGLQDLLELKVFRVYRELSVLQDHRGILEQ